MSVVEGVLIEHETSDGESVKSGDGNAEFGWDEPPCKENGVIWGPNSIGDVAGRLPAIRTRRSRCPMVLPFLLFYGIHGGS